MVQSRRKTNGVVSSTGIAVETCYCRRCRENKKTQHFYVATDLYIDTNGFMSVCKDCIQDIYVLFLATSPSMEHAIYRLCRLFNVRYDERAVQAMYVHMEKLENKGVENPTYVFGLYKNKLLAVQKNAIVDRDMDLFDFTFVEPTHEALNNLSSEEIDNVEYYENAWGKGSFLSAEDYEFLEQEFAKWKRTTNCDTQSEEVLVREICHKQNEIRKARIEGKTVDGLVKSLQEIMKNSALTPALQNAASSGKSVDAFGSWIKDIEQLTPAEWFKNQTKYKDMDGIEEDRKDIKRSIQNFVTGSRDFNTLDLEEISGDEDEIELGMLGTEGLV